MSNPSKQKGTKFETAITRHLNAKGIPAERCALHGSSDVGDIRAVIGGEVLIIECKDCKRIELAKWFDETEREVINAGGDIGVLVIHRAGCGPAKVGGNYAVIDLDELISLLKLRQQGKGTT